MEQPAKGTVTPFASMFPAEEAQKAAKRVEDAVAEKQKELNHLNQFVSDNTNLINLVSRLPDELHHDIMVPFGKAAFFPGKLVHTNELMVLLGEGYFAERTAKQTVEILKRRGKALDSQVQALKANMEDLRAEASFFDSTASQAVEGLVEIREDYVEDISSEKQFKSDEKKAAVEDDEFSRMMSRMDELELEELAAEYGNDSDDVEQIDRVEIGDDVKAGAGDTDTDSDTDMDSSEIRKPEQPAKTDYTAGGVLSTDYHHRLDVTDGSNCTGLTVLSEPKDGMHKGGSLTRIVDKSLSSEKGFVPLEVKEKVKAASSSNNEAFRGSTLEHTRGVQRISEQQTMSSSQTSKPSNSGFDSSKALTGSIVERAHNIQTSQEQSSTSSQPSKPVSRFKMQRR